MSGPWKPEQYHDENRELLHNWIEKKIKTGKSIAEDIHEKAKQKPAKVIDFMTLLKKSIEEKEMKIKQPSKRTNKKQAGKRRPVENGLAQGKNKKKRIKK